MNYRCLGPLAAEVDGVAVDLGQPQQRLVLAMLLVNRDTVVSTDRLADAVWGDTPPENGRKIVQGYVSGLRKTLGTDTIESRNAGYRLITGAQSVDADTFEKSLEQGIAGVRSNPQGVVEVLTDALALWRGRPFEDLADFDVLRPEISRLEQLQEAALETRIEAQIYAGNAGAVTSELSDLTRRLPFRERFWSLRMLALYRTSRQTEALRVYDEVRRVLATEVGLEPSPELRLLNERILQQDPALDTVAAFDIDASHDGVSSRNPYKGLSAFGEDDADDFHGRADLVRRLREVLKRRTSSRLVVLAGPSGSGKSSVVGAGLIPKLRQDGWSIVTLYPGSTPLESLASALDAISLDGEAALIVDQLEEVITLAPEGTREQFLDHLAEVASQANGPWVIATVRADFLDRLLLHPRLAALINQRLVLITPLEDHEVRDAITRPASSVGVAVDPDLVAAMVRDVGHRAQALPLLQYALTDLYDRSAGGELRFEALRAAGGISGALAKRAEDLYASLGDDGGLAARQLFLRLIVLTPEGEGLRRRVTTESVAAIPDVDDVLDAFGRHRLVSFDRDSSGQATVEIAHEALLAGWPRLGGWVDEARDTLRMRQHLADAAQEWEANDRADTYLMAGARLARYSDWEEGSLVASPDEATFLAASRDYDQVVANRRRRRRTMVLAGFGAAAVVATLLAVVALVARNDAADAAATAQQNEALAHSRELAASSVSLLDDDPELSMLLALQAIDDAPGKGAFSAAGTLALRDAVQRHRLLGRIPGDFAEAQISPDGSTIFVSSESDRTVRALDAATGSVLWTFEDSFAVDAVWRFQFFVRMLALSLSPDGTMLAVSIPNFPDIDTQQAPVGALGVGDTPARVVVLDTATGQEIRSLEFGACGLSTAQISGFTADGKWLAVATGSEDCFEDPEAFWTVLYDPVTWNEGPRIQIEEMGLESVFFSSDGSQVLIVDARSGNAELRLFPDLELVNQLPPGRTWPLFGSGGGQALIDSPEASHRLLLIDAREGDRLAYLDIDDFISGIGPAFAPDGLTIAVPTQTHDYVFDASSGQKLVDLGNTGVTESLHMTADGSRMVAVNADGLLIWDVGEAVSAVGTPITIPGRDVIWINPNTVAEGPATAIGVVVDDGPNDAEDVTMTAILDTADGSTIDVVPGDGIQLDDGRFVVALRPPGVEGRPIGPLVVLDPESDASVVLDECVAPLGALDAGDEIDCPTPFFSWYGFSHSHLVLSADGSYFAATSYATLGSDRTVRVWDSDSLEVLSEFSIPNSYKVVTGGAGWLVAVPDFVVSQEATLTVYDVGSGEVVAELEVPRTLGSWANAVVGNGEILLAGDDDGLVIAFDTISWKQIGSWRAHGSSVRGVAVSPDGGRLVTTGQDDLVKVWDISGLIEDRSVVGAPPLLDRVPAHFPSDAVWLSSERLGVFLSDPVQYIEITLDIDDLVGEAVTRLTRSFSVEECALYQIDPCPTLEEVRAR